MMATPLTHAYKRGARIMLKGWQKFGRKVGKATRTGYRVRSETQESLRSSRERLSLGWSPICEIVSKVHHKLIKGPSIRFFLTELDAHNTYLFIRQRKVYVIIFKCKKHNFSST